MRAFLLCAACAVLLPGGAPARADRLVTHDGRVLEVRRARQLPGGVGYRLLFENGEIVCPERFVASVEIEGDMSDYEPRSDDEREKLARGYVRYRGRWMSKAAYRGELKREAEARRERVAELAARADFASGWEKETRHFRFRTNTSPELLDHYAELLEAYYDLMDGRVSIDPTPNLRRTKMQVNIYRGREDWERNNEAGVDSGVAGYFSFKDESLNFFHDYDDPSLTDWVALHECTHLLTYLIQPEAWPSASAIWVNEGVADYLGSSEITRDEQGRLRIRPGRIQIDRVLTVQQAIADGEHVALERLFAVRPEDFTALEYAHAWSFVHFLNSDPQREKGFWRFFRDFYSIPGGVECSWQPFGNQRGAAKIIPAAEVRRLLLEALGTEDVAALEEEWLRFVAAIRIDTPEARFRRAYVQVRTLDFDHFEQAARDLDAAIEQGFEDPRAYWARGQVRAREASDPRAGTADFRRAVELSPLNADFRFALGQSLTGASPLEAGASRDGRRSGPEALAEALVQYGLACELAPQVDAYRQRYEEVARASGASRASHTRREGDRTE